MPKSYDMQASTTVGSISTTQHVVFDSQGNPQYSYTSTNSYSSGILRVLQRTYSGSAGSNWRDVEPSLRPVRTCSDDQLISDSGILRTTVTSLGYGLVAYTSEDTYSIGGLPSDTTLASFPNTSEQAVAKLFAKLRDLKVSLPVMAAEASKTAKHLGDTANRLYRAMRFLKAGNIPGMVSTLKASRSPKEKIHSRLLRWVRSQPSFRKALKDGTPCFTDLSALWLEYKYAWGPLIQDTYGLAELLAEHFLDNDKTKWHRISVVVKQHKAWSTPSSYYRQICECDYIYKLGGFARYKTSMPSSAFQAGLTNPLEVAWELVPFSFVADWFVNIGDILSAISTLQGLEFRGGYASQLWDQKSSTIVVTPKSSAPYTTTYRSLSSPCSYGRRFYSRSIYTPSIPALRFKPDPFSLSHILSGVALTAQAIKRL